MQRERMAPMPDEHTTKPIQKIITLGKEQLLIASLGTHHVNPGKYDLKVILDPLGEGPEGRCNNRCLIHCNDFELE